MSNKRDLLLEQFADEERQLQRSHENQPVRAWVRGEDGTTQCVELTDERSR